MQTQTAINSKKPVRKTSSSKKAIRAADLAKAYNINPKQLRKTLRAKGIRSPYDAGALVKIERICKEMAKAH